MKRVTKAEMMQAGVDVTQIRMVINGEAELLAKDYNPRLIAYVCLTTAMMMAQRSGLGPKEFAHLTTNTLALFSRAAKGDDTSLRSIFVGLSDPTEE